MIDELKCQSKMTINLDTALLQPYSVRTAIAYRGDAMGREFRRRHWKESGATMAIEKRTYAKSEEAKAALDELFANGFTDVSTSFKPDRVMVAVNAPFGEGAKAAKILDSYPTLPMTDEELEGESVKAPALARKAFDFETAARSATPLSDFFGWTVLNDYRSPLWPAALIDDPTPLSNKFNWSVLYGASR